MSSESLGNTKAIGFLVGALIAGFGLGELGSVGITGQATGAFGDEPELTWSYDRNFVQYCIENDKKTVDHCILEAACQNMNSDYLGKVFKQEVYKGMKLTAKGEPFYWDDMSEKGNDTAILLLNNLCADFRYWLPSKELVELPNGVREPMENRPPVEPVNRVVRADNEVELGVSEEDVIAAENSDAVSALPRVIDFDVSDAVRVNGEPRPDPSHERVRDGKFNQRDMPVCEGKLCIHPKYWQRGTLVSQESCAKHFGASVRAIHGTKRLVGYMAQQRCNWVPDNN
jgi:hypothetical protein